MQAKLAEIISNVGFHRTWRHTVITHF